MLGLVVKSRTFEVGGRKRGGGASIKANVEEYNRRSLSLDYIAPNEQPYSVTS